MHPAPSVIVFTTFSGLGFGLLVWLGLGLPPVTGWVAFGLFALAYLLAVGGLAASAFHLGRPERALKAFTQWRTSWLSREAWASVVTLIVMAIYGAGLVFFDTRWNMLGWIGALSCLLTVLTTAMIYGSLRAVPRWNMALTPVLFLVLSLAGGALLAGQRNAAIGLLALAGGVQVFTWVRGDGALARSDSDMASATGLGDGGRVRSFEPPHTGPNYLLREFAYQVGRRHARRLRVIAILLMAVFPVALLLLPLGFAGTAIAALCHITGVLAARWLFFAQAEHVVGFFYGLR